MSVDSLDQSWGEVDPNTAKAAGIKLICGYLSYDPSKNWTAARIKRYHAVGIGVLLNWEAVQDAPFEGAGRGASDAQEAVRQAQALIAQVGKPSHPIVIVFSVDRDVNPSQYPALDAYFAATKAVTHAAGFLNGVYGEADLMDHLHNAGLTDVEWQTLAWSNGRISAYTDLYQSSINNNLGGTSIDNDRILNAPGVGGWWPTGSGAESTDSNGAIQIGEEMSSTEYVALAKQMTSIQAALANIQDQNHRTGVGVNTDYADLKARLVTLAHNLNTVAGSITERVHSDNVAMFKRTIDQVSHMYGQVDQITPLITTLHETGGNPDLAPVLDAISKLPADMRAELAKHLGA